MKISFYLNLNLDEGLTNNFRSTEVVDTGFEIFRVEEDVQDQA